MSVDLKKMFTAIESNDTKLVKYYLVQKNIPPDALFETNLYDSIFTWSGLHAAAYHGSIQIVNLLLEHGANVELEDTWYRGRPLAWAAFGGKFLSGSFKRMFVIDLILTNMETPPLSLKPINRPSGYCQATDREIWG